MLVTITNLSLARIFMGFIISVWEEMCTFADGL